MAAKLANKLHKQNLTVSDHLNAILSKQWRMKLLICFALSVVFINIMIPMFADDYSYSYIFGASHPMRLSSVHDILISQSTHYMIWGGRIVVHGMLQLLLLSNSIILIAGFKIACYFSLMLVIYLFVKRGKAANFDYDMLLIISLLYWVFSPRLGECNFWTTGALNYLFGPLLLLTFLLPVWLLHYKYITKTTLIFKLLWLGVAFIAGFTNENSTIAVSCLLLFFLYEKYTQKCLAIYDILLSLCFVSGMLMLLLAPGNFARANISGLQFWHQMTLFERTWYSFHKYFLWAELHNIFLLLAFVYLYNKEQDSVAKKPALTLLVVSILANFVMIATPYAPERTWNFGFILNIIAVLLLLNRNTIVLSANKKIITVMRIVIIYFFFSLVAADVMYYILHKENAERIRIVTHSDKTKLVAVQPYSFKDTNAVFLTDLRGDKNSWLNQSYSQYYGLESGIVAISNKK